MEFFITGYFFFIANLMPDSIALGARLSSKAGNGLKGIST
jgi:hypothetical protein